MVNRAFSALVDDESARHLNRLHHIVTVLDAALDADAEATMWLRHDDDDDAIDLMLRSWVASHALDREMNIETNQLDVVRALPKSVHIWTKNGHAIQRIATVYWRLPKVAP